MFLSSSSVSPVSSTTAASRRGQAAVEAEPKQEVGAQNRKPGAGEAGSPFLGNANNPNVGDIPERRNTPAAATVSVLAGSHGLMGGASCSQSQSISVFQTAASSMTRRNTYVCSSSDRTSSSTVHNGKENR